MEFLSSWKTQLGNHSKMIDDFIKESKKLCTDYEYRKSQKFDIGFNVFKISSDLYYRENFQSDIIAAFLNPVESHKEGNKYLHLFIELLNKINPQRHIEKGDFENSQVVREENRIDILITDSVSKKVIIVENKINDATDTNRQLPRYVQFIKDNYKDYELVSIAYITLKSHKAPDTKGWTESEIAEIFSLLKIFPSFGFDKNISLYNNWIIPSILQSNNIDSSFILRQYGNLLKHLTTNDMDTVILEKFRDSIFEKDNLKTAISIRNMLNELPEYLAIRIENKYKNNCNPFKSIYRYKGIDTVFEAFEMDNLYLKLDIWCSIDGYKVHFWNPRNTDYDVLKELSFFETLKDFLHNGNDKNNVVKFFNIDSENELFEFIDKLQLELRSFKSNSAN